MKQTDFLIIGQGLAGSLVAFLLLKRGYDVVVIDEERESTPSRISAGMYTPVSGKRMVKSRGLDAALAFALQTYRDMEEMLGIQALEHRNIYTVFGSVKEQNDLSLKMESGDFSQHIIGNPIPEPHIRQPFGAFEVQGCGRVNLKLLLDSFRARLIENGQFISARFDYHSLQQENGEWRYENVKTRHVIFCEGTRAQHNLFFPNLPFRFCKGDVLTIRCAGLRNERVIKKGIGIVPLGGELFKIGSTYEWNDLTEQPTAKGRATLVKKLDELLELPYTIVSHEAAVRPTTVTREVIVARHERYHNMYLLNGLGTKGVLNGPAVARQLVEMME